jgi:NAD(P)-dependent dehydrogenase (short-subunit alcohol dehydrogenase family)
VRQDFDGRTVLLTGGLGSLGRAQASAFLAAGATLLLVDRPDHDRTDDILQDIADANSRSRLRFIGQDLGDLEAAAPR